MIKNFKFQDSRSGQGVMESVFAVGVLALILSGAVILVVLGSSNRRASFDRRKATELASAVTEDLIDKSQNEAEAFWKFDFKTGGYVSGS